MIREAIITTQGKKKLDLNNDDIRTPLIRANEFFVYENGILKLHYVRKSSFWKRSEMYSPNNWENPKWTPLKKDVSSTTNGAEIIESLIVRGYEIDKIDILN